MPKNCNECRFSTWSNLHQTAACARHGFDPCFKDHSREYKEKKADFCPLVEVPAPHGRLIDADKLEPDSDYDDGEYWAVSMAQIENAPTVIEAEEGED